MAEEPDPETTANPASKPLDLLAARSSIRVFGATEIFVDRSDARLVEISPEAAAAKLITDLLFLIRRLPLSHQSCLLDRRLEIIEPVRKLVTPLISGETPWLQGVTTPEQMFFHMLDRVDPENTARQDRACSAKTGFRMVVGEERIIPVIPVMAVFLTMDVLLDGADIRMTLAKSVKLNMPQMFRCLCHLLAKPEIWTGQLVPEGSDDTGNRRQVLSACLGHLRDDRITRSDPDPSMPTGSS